MDQILHRLPITLAHAIPTNQRETLLGREFGVFRPQRYSYQLSMHINQGASLLENDSHTQYHAKTLPGVIPASKHTN